MQALESAGRQLATLLKEKGILKLKLEQAIIYAHRLSLSIPPTQKVRE